jgi:hypothetical protein
LRIGGHGSFSRTGILLLRHGGGAVDYSIPDLVADLLGAGIGRNSYQMICSSIVDTSMPRSVQPDVRYQFEFTKRRIAADVGVVVSWRCRGT